MFDGDELARAFAAWVIVVVVCAAVAGGGCVLAYQWAADRVDVSIDLSPEGRVDRRGERGEG